MHIVDIIDEYLAGHGERVRAIDDTGQWTGARLSERARRLSGRLQAHGIGRGDRVGVMMTNGVDVFVAYEAVWRTGAAITPIMPALVEREVAHILDSARPSSVITSDGLTETVRSARARVGASFLLIGGEDGTGDITLAEAESAEPAADITAGGDDLAALLFTGGTTGRSKGVMLSHHNLATTVRIAATGVEHRADDLGLVTLPLSHGFGIVVFLVTFAEPLCLLVRRRFDPAEVAAIVEREDITQTDAVPTMLQALLDTGHAHSGAFRSLRSVLRGRVVLSSRPPGGVRGGHGCARVRGVRADRVRGPHRGRRPVAAASPGERRPSVRRRRRARRRPNGGDVASGQVGEVIARSEAMMRGYWNDEETTAEAIRDGWLYTGDLGSQDEDGYLRIVGRRKELIIRAGFNIHPADLENVIRGCPGVTDACVFGRPDRALGEQVVAAVVGTCTPEDVERHCAASVAGHKRPDVVLMVESLPRTTVGKPDRKALAALVTPAP